MVKFLGVSGVDDEDRIFVQTYEKDERGFYDYDIFDGAGKYLNRTALASFPSVIKKTKCIELMKAGMDFK